LKAGKVNEERGDKSGCPLGDEGQAPDGPSLRPSKKFCSFVGLNPGRGFTVLKGPIEKKKKGNGKIKSWVKFQHIIGILE